MSGDEIVYEDMGAAPDHLVVVSGDVWRAKMMSPDGMDDGILIQLQVIADAAVLTEVSLLFPWNGALSLFRTLAEALDYPDAREEAA